MSNPFVEPRKPSTVISTRNILVDKFQTLWDGSATDEEAAAIADWLLSHNYISNVLFEEVEGE